MSEYLPQVTFTIPVADFSLKNSNYLIMAITNLLNNANSCNIIVASTEAMPSEIYTLIHRLTNAFRKRFGVRIDFVNLPGKSLGQMNAALMDMIDMDHWWFNHDVDLVLTERALYYIKKAILNYRDVECFFYNFVDIEPRGIGDWTLEPQPSPQAQQIAHQRGEQELIYRKWTEFKLLKANDVWTGAFVAKRSAVDKTLIRQLNNIEPGERGMDRLVCKHFCRREKAFILLGATAYHLGIEPLWHGPWKKFSPMVADDVAKFMPHLGDKNDDGAS